jgi:hypothetical protein
MSIDTAAREQAVKIGQRFNQLSRAVREDKALSEHAKKATLAHHWRATQSRLLALKGEHQAEVEREHRRLELELFGHAADPDIYRAALAAAAAQIDSPAKAEAALRRADRTGDEVAAKAALTISLEKGFGSAVDAYKARNPGAAAALTEFRNFEQAMADPQDRLFSPFKVLRPPELPTRDEAIDALAREAPALAS